MDYKEIEQHFKNAETLDELLEEYKEVFDEIDFQKFKMAGKQLTNYGEAEECLQILTGMYMSIAPVAEIITGEKINRETAFEVNRKNELELENDDLPPKEQKKIVAQLIKSEASVFVARYRTVRNVFKGYLNSCEKGINSCQSIMKQQKKESYMTDTKQD